MANDVRRHLICPLFAPRFVSAFFFRAQGSAAARCDESLEEGGAVYAVSARGLDVGTDRPKRYSYSLRTAVAGESFRPPRRMAPPYVRKFSI